MPAFSLTTPKKPAVAETPSATLAPIPPLAALQSQQTEPQLRRGSRAKLPVKPQTSPPSNVKVAAPQKKVKAKKPSRHNKPPTPSPPSSGVEEITVKPKEDTSPRQKREWTPLARAVNYDSGSELSSAPPTPPHATRQRKAAASTPVYAETFEAELRPLTPPPSRLKGKPATRPKKATPPRLTPSNIFSPPLLTSKVDAKAVLESLGAIVSSEVEYWAHHMSHIGKLSSYHEITDSNHSNPSSAAVHGEVPVGGREDEVTKKQKALIYILQTLPLRYKALAAAYGASPDEVSNLELSDFLLKLLTFAKGEGGGDYDDDYDDLERLGRKLLPVAVVVGGKGGGDGTFRNKVLSLDEEVRVLELSRMDELTNLIRTVEELKLAAEDGHLAHDCHDEALKSLIGAMDAMGLSAAAGLDAMGLSEAAGKGSEVTNLGGGVRMSGVRSEDEWISE